MIIRTQKLLFDIILFLYGLVAIFFATRTIWITKKRVNEAFQFLLAAIILWTIVKLVEIVSDLKIVNVYAVSLGELFFITLLIVGMWYLNHMLMNKQRKKIKS